MIRPRLTSNQLIRNRAWSIRNQYLLAFLKTRWLLIRILFSMNSFQSLIQKILSVSLNLKSVIHLTRTIKNYQLVELYSNFSPPKYQEPLKTSDVYVQVKRLWDYTIETISFIELSKDLWSKVEIFKTETVPEEKVSMDESLLMSRSGIHIPIRV